MKGKWQHYSVYKDMICKAVEWRVCYFRLICLLLWQSNRGKRERASLCYFTPQLGSEEKTWLKGIHETGTPSSSPWWIARGPVTLLLSWVSYQVARGEVEQPELRLALWHGETAVTWCAVSQCSLLGSKKRRWIHKKWLSCRATGAMERKRTEVQGGPMWLPRAVSNEKATTHKRWSPFRC